MLNINGQPSGDYGTSLMMLQGAVAFVLLIACANVAGLLLARGASRARARFADDAWRAADARIVRQVLTESLPLTTLGATFGVLIAWLGLKCAAHTRPVWVSAPRGGLARPAGSSFHRGRRARHQPGFCGHTRDAGLEDHSWHSVATVDDDDLERRASTAAQCAGIRTGCHRPRATGWRRPHDPQLRPRARKRTGRGPEEPPDIRLSAAFS